MLHERFVLPEYLSLLGHTNSQLIEGGDVLLSLALVMPCLNAAASFGASESRTMLTNWREHRGDHQDGV